MILNSMSMCIPHVSHMSHVYNMYLQVSHMYHKVVQYVAPMASLVIVLVLSVDGCVQLLHGCQHLLPVHLQLLQQCLLLWKQPDEQRPEIIAITRLIKNNNNNKI